MKRSDNYRHVILISALSIFFSFLIIYWALCAFYLSYIAKILIIAIAALPFYFSIRSLHYLRLNNYLISFSGILLLLLFMEAGIRIALLLGVTSSGDFKKAVPENALQMPFYNREAATYDSMSGFRWDTIPTSVMKISDGRIEYQNTFRGNNYGYHTAKNYTPKKSPGTFRILVLGDSFTDAFFLSHPWPVQVEKALNKEGLPVEVYSFAVNGGGIVNWHNIFFKQIVPEFEFDMIILAIFGNDLDRDFFVMEHRNSLATAMYFSDPPTHSEFENTLKSTPGLQIILPSNDFQKIHHYFKTPIGWNEPDFLTINLLHNLMLNALSNKDRSPGRSGLHEKFIYTNAHGDIPGIESINEKYGSKKMRQLEEIVTFAKSHNKEILFLCIPEQEGAHLTAMGNQVQISLELELLANHWGLPYLNGYQAYPGVNDSLISKHFMSPDGHWNQEGSDHFVSYVVPFISRAISSVIQN